MLGRTPAPDCQRHVTNLHISFPSERACGELFLWVRVPDPDGPSKARCRSEAPGAPFLASFARSGDFDPERSLRRKTAAPLDTQPAELPNFSPAPFHKTLDQRGFHHLSGGSPVFPIASRYTPTFLALVLAAALAPAAFASGPYLVGSSNTVTADPNITRPTTTPCIVQLMSNAEFDNFNPY